MASLRDHQEIASLLKQLNERVNSLQDQHVEADRVAAVKAARDLMVALDTPQEALMKLVYAPTHALCVRIAIDLDLFKTLAEKDGPVTLEELAAVKNADPVLVGRVLRVLTGIGYVTEHDERAFKANKMTKHMTGRFAIATSQFIWDGMPALASIPEFLEKTKFKNPSGAANGPFQYAEKIDVAIWDYLPNHPDKLDHCSTFMEGDRGSRPSWLEWFPVKEQVIDGFNKEEGDVLLVDVAGGRGHDIGAFHKAFPDAPGRLVVEDLPHVVDDIQNLDPAVERVKINMFEGQPIKGARTYYMKFILHDWSDSESRSILTHIASAMKRGYSKFIIEEFILADKDCALLPAMWDWEMMVFCNSMERTAKQWSELLESVGMKVVKFWYPPGDGQGIIEAELKDDDEPVQNGAT
ncbi:hypothetical protein AJ80_01213 [Polytolypa hystricis UAMH7299]|uniref:Uncharacterized protein n=1 Tax=Polytolypa hystricis (strain UAMH7299) TaxID=1447883 RepID=A0A2B7Z1M5_POLH7|nr:hypothetical protein AJ80_01213 [Polytolypa hystricis UAMH7299]